MKISYLKNPIKVCDIVLNTLEGKPLWNIIWNNEIPNNILSQNNGRCYYIVVNGDIFKIGYSDCNGGIKSTIRSYRSSGNGGRPSDRTHGIHVLIAEQLLIGNKVEFYFHYVPLMKNNLELMDGSIVSIDRSLSGKILEEYNMEIYKKIHNDLPIWNLQEAGKPWPLYIQESRNNLLRGNSITLQDIRERLIKTS